MKNLLLLLIVLPTVLFGQQEVPQKYWLDDSNYEEVINGNSAFGDDDEDKVVVVEYWAKFNEANCYPHWKELADDPNIDYYRVNIADAPKVSKANRIRMAPTMFIIFRGVIETKFKAGLDLEFPVTQAEVKEAIEEAQNSDKF